MNDSSQTRSATPRSLVAALAVVTVAFFASVGPGNGAPLPAGPETFPQALQRIVKTRVIHTRISTVRNSNSRRIGRALASLHPSWVSGMIRYAQGQHPKHREVRAWLEITRIVRTANPQAKFDVTLNADQYGNGQELQRMMHRVRSKLDNDGWFLDFLSTAHRKRPRMIRAAIASAHANGEFIGGNVFGISKKRPVPLQADFLAVQDFRFRLNLKAVGSLASQVPVVYHLHNHPEKPRGGGCRFIERFSTGRRQAYIRRRAKQQVNFGFRLQYPALFPECTRDRPDGRSILYSYNAFRDPPMARTIRRLLDLYD